MAPIPSQTDTSSPFQFGYCVRTPSQQARESEMRRMNQVLVSPTDASSETAQEVHNNVAAASHYSALGHGRSDYFFGRHSANDSVEGPEYQSDREGYYATTEESFPMRSQRNTMAASNVSTSESAISGSVAMLQPRSLEQVRRVPSERPTTLVRIDNRFVSAPMPDMPPTAAQGAFQEGRTPSVSFAQRPSQASASLPSYHSTRNLSRSTAGSLAYVTTPTSHPSPQQQQRPHQHEFSTSGMPHSYSMPCLVSNASPVHVGSPLRPILQHNNKSEGESFACELGMVQHRDEKANASSRTQHHDATRGGLAGLYDRMVASTAGSVMQSGMQPPMRQLSGGHQQSMAYILGQHDEPMEPEDPRITGVARKSTEIPRSSFLRTFSSSQPPKDDHNGKRRSRSKSLAHIVDDIKGASILNGSLGASPRKQRYHSSVEADIEQRRKFVLKMARALMLFGAPSHRVESQLNALASVLTVDAQFIHFPGIVITSFGDCETNMSQCRFVKSKTAIALGRLTDLHLIYKHVMADKVSVDDAAHQLDVLLKSPPEWSNLSRILFSMVKCGMMAPINFGGSFVDIWISAAFGGLLTFSQLCLAGNNEMISNVFDIAVAILFSFLARLLSSRSVFCYEAVASSGLIGLLPGYAILCASLELASKNMMTGSVRMVYAIIYSLFLGFAIAIGSELYYWADPKARFDVLESVVKQTEITGSFLLSNTTMPYWNGTFTFTDGTVDAQSIGHIGCVRLDNWPWWRQTVPSVSKAVTVPIFSLLSCLSFLHPLLSRETPISVVIACIGYAANSLANKYIFDRSDVVSAIGSFVIGLLGNAYARMWNRSAFTSITVAVNFLVPSGLAMAGGLAMTHKGSDGDLYSNGLSLGFRMVQVSIGITTGLFVSALLVHVMGNKRSNAVLFAF